MSSDQNESAKKMSLFDFIEQSSAEPPLSQKKENSEPEIPPVSDNQVDNQMLDPQTEDCQSTGRPLSRDTGESLHEVEEADRVAQIEEAFANPVAEGLPDEQVVKGDEEDTGSTRAENLEDDDADQQPKLEPIRPKETSPSEVENGVQDEQGISAEPINEKSPAVKKSQEKKKLGKDNSSKRSKVNQNNGEKPERKQPQRKPQERKQVVSSKNEKDAQPIEQPLRDSDETVRPAATVSEPVEEPARVRPLPMEAVTVPKADRGPIGLSGPTLTSVGLLGPVFAGKTTYFAVLMKALQRLGWHVQIYRSEDDSSTQVFAEGERATDPNGFLFSLLEALDAGHFPSKTANDESDRTLQFRIEKNTKRFDLRFFDPPGEAFDKQGKNRNQANAVRERVFRSIQDCNGLLVTLNLDRNPADLPQIWNRSIGAFIHHLEQKVDGRMVEKGKLTMRTCVVLTKADQIPFMARLRKRNAEAWMRGNPALSSLTDVIKRSCPNVRFEFSSAIGWSSGLASRRTTPRPFNLALPDEKTACDKEGQVDYHGHLKLATLRPGELIPDPSSGDRDGVPRPPVNPIFQDPMQLRSQAEMEIEQAELEFEEELSKRRGMLTFPGRVAPTSAPDPRHPELITPWNIVEPLLWAAER